MSETTALNPTIVGEQVSSLLVQPLEAASVVLAAGPKIFDSAEPLRIPTVVSGATVGLVGESELIPEADVQFGEIKLMPSDRKSIKTLVRFSNELARQSVIGLDSALKNRLVGDVAYKLDSELLNGTGADGGILGLVNQPTAQQGVLDVTETDSLLDAIAMAYSAEVKPNRWILSGADFMSLRKLKGTDGKYLLESDVAADATYRLFGIPVTVTNKLATGKAILADMSQVAVVRDLNPSVTVLSERFAEYDEQAIRVVTRYDLGLLHPEGVVVLTDAV